MHKANLKDTSTPNEFDQSPFSDASIVDAKKLTPFMDGYVVISPEMNVIQFQLGIATTSLGGCCCRFTPF